MGRIPYFDFCATIILMILLFTMIFRRMTSGRLNKAFIALLIVILCTTVFDAVSTSHLSAITDPQRKESVRMAASTLYFVFRILEGPVYIYFVGMLTGTWSRFRRNNVFFGVLVAPYILSLILLVINLPTKIFFSYTSEGKYHREVPIYIFYLIGLFYLLTALFMLLKARNLLESDKLMAMFSIFPLIGAAMVVQFFQPDYLLEMFALSISAMLITAIVMRPEETLDIVTGAKSYKAFTTDVQKCFHAGIPFSVILVKIKNSTALLALLGNENHQKMLRDVVGILRPMNASRLKKINHEIYYLYNGLYAVMADGQLREEYSAQEADRIFRTLNGSFHSQHLDLDLDISVCRLMCPDDIDNLAELNTFANSFDENLSDTEVSVLSKIAPEKQFQVKNSINDIISQGIINHNFEMYYQPIFSVKDQAFTTAEALIRLKDENNGMVSPGLFIPSAEKSGAIHQIGDFVVQDVCRFISENNLEKLGLSYIEINLSAIQCMRNSVVQKVQDTLDEYHVAPEKVNFEITETASDFVHDTIRKNILELHSHGLQFALDDYGTGYSNLQRVVDFPFKIIKLDKRFVDEWKNPKMRNVIQNTIHMIKDIGDEIVVEGVETKECAEWFASQGCEYIQGFYYAKPMPEKEFLEFLVKHNTK